MTDEFAVDLPGHGIGINPQGTHDEEITGSRVRYLTARVPVDTLPSRKRAKHSEERTTMAARRRQDPPAAAPTGEVRRIKVGVMPLFSTWVYSCEDGPRHLNQRLERLAQKLRRDDRNATRRTNYGGWHYAFDVF